VDAPRHAKAQYAPRHSRPTPSRRLTRAITPVTLAGVLALGTVSAVAVPVLHSTGSSDDLLLADAITRP
jgi:hypothetical protein